MGGAVEAAPPVLRLLQAQGVKLGSGPFQVAPHLFKCCNRVFEILRHGVRLHQPNAVTCFGQDIATDQNTHPRHSDPKGKNQPGERGQGVQPPSRNADQPVPRRDDPLNERIVILPHFDVDLPTALPEQVRSHLYPQHMCLVGN